MTPDEAAIECCWQVGRQNQWRGQQEVFPRGAGPFVRTVPGLPDHERELVVGRWGLIPWFAKTSKLAYSTNNARFEGIESKASFKRSWAHGQRCIIPAWSFDEPCWETGRNVWWRFRRADGEPWGLAGLWNEWIDPESGEILQTYSMLTINADDHPLMSRMHKPDPTLPPDGQDKRSVVSIELTDVDQWLHGSIGEIAGLVRAPAVDVIDAAPGY
jgi:putative SOS response-associated peptidase YedK